MSGQPSRDRITAAFRVTLWLSWATVAWAGWALIVRLSVHMISNPAANLILASGVVALKGAVLGLVYLLIVARNRSDVLKGGLAVTLNLAYAALFLSSLGARIDNPRWF